MSFFKELIKKNLFNFVAMGLLLIGIVISIVVFTSFLKHKNDIEDKIISELSFLKSFKTAEENAPTLEWINYLNRKKEGLNEILSEIMTEFNRPATRMPKEVKESLKFKEEIFNVQRKIKEESESKKLRLGEKALSLGFKEYETKIPIEEEVPNLTKELDIIQELISLMYLSEVKNLEDVGFLECKDGFLEKNGEKLDYRIFYINLEIITPIKNLAQFFHELSRSEFIFIVEMLELEALDENNGRFVIEELKVDPSMDPEYESFVYEKLNGESNFNNSEDEIKSNFMISCVVWIEE